MSVAILKSESPRKSRILRPGADIDALRRIEAMTLDEDDAQSGQRLSAPALRRARGVRTVEDLDRDAEPFLHACEVCVHLLASHRSVRDLRAPGQPEQQPAFVLVSSKHRSAIGERVVAPDDQRLVGERRVVRPLEGHDVDSRESFRGIRRLELALMAELHARCKRADVALDRLLHLVRSQQASMVRDNPRNGIHLRVLDAGGEPDASHGRPSGSRPGRHARATHATCRCCRARFATALFDEALEIRQQARSDPPASSRFNRAYPCSTNARAAVLLPAPGSPMMSTTSLFSGGSEDPPLRSVAP